MEEQMETSESNMQTVHVEVCLENTVHRSLRTSMQHLVLDCLNTGQPKFVSGAVDLLQYPQLEDSVKSIHIDTEKECSFWEADLKVHTFQLSQEGPYEEATEDDESSTAFTSWELPNTHLVGLWESLLFDSDVKNHLLEFAATSLLFSSMNVDSNIISWNHVVLLHGPPGTGKTSLCKALAQKLSIRMDQEFKTAQLLEINSHSLFSKWFSESGKLVSKLFGYIRELTEDPNMLVFILLDEVESLAAARKASLSGSEPSDSIRVVNSLLTQIDALKTKKNVMVLTTSNLTDAIDVAFVDRADIKQYIGLPSIAVRKQIISGCIRELCRAGIIKSCEDLNNAMLDECCAATEGFSGRALRKLPFQTFARKIRKRETSLEEFLKALGDSAREESVSMEA